MKANSLATAALVLGALAVGSCSGRSLVPPAVVPVPPPNGPRRATPTPPPAQAQAPAPAPQDWRDAPITPGNWQYSNAGGRPVASFAGGRLVLTCEAGAGTGAATVRLQRRDAGAIVTAPGALRILTQTSVRVVNASLASGGHVATIAARDPLLDAMAFSRGRFAVEATGLPPLYVPSWTEVSRLVEDCR